MQPLVIDNKPDQGFNVCLTQSPVQQNKKQQRLSKMQLNAFLDNFSPDSKRYCTIQSPEVGKVSSAFNKTVNFASSLNRAEKELEDNCVSNMKSVSSNRITSS